MKKILAVLIAALFVVSMSTMAFAANVENVIIKTLPTKVSYTVGDTFDATGLTLTAKFDDSTTDTIIAGFTCTGFDSTTAGTKTITVTYEGKTATFDVTVKAAETTTAAATEKKLTLIEALNAVRKAYNDKVVTMDENGNVVVNEDLAWAYAEVFSEYAEDIDAITARQKLVQSSSLYPDNWTEFVKIYTDYIPTAVNQQLDIAARLGWDASDQDFVQDVIDLVKGAAESDKAADKAADTASTDANPKTGSTSAIAVFAVLSVAAAAVVCTKKKED